MFLVLQPFVATPSKVSIFSGEQCLLNLFGPYSIDTPDTLNEGTYEIPIRLFGVKVKSVSAEVAEPVYLVPGGQAVGMRSMFIGLKACSSFTESTIVMSPNKYLSTATVRIFLATAA